MSPLFRAKLFTCGMIYITSFFGYSCDCHLELLLLLIILFLSVPTLLVQLNKGLNSVPIISTLAVVFSHQVQAYHFSSLGKSGFCNRTNRLRPALVLVELHFLHSDERKLIIYYHCFP